MGFDQYGYSYRDVRGDVFHMGRGHDYGEPYCTGDTIGLLIHLPATAAQLAARNVRPCNLPLDDRPRPFEFKGQPYFEVPERPPTELRPCPGRYAANAAAPVHAAARWLTLRRSAVVFFKNGRCQGVAFRDINAGTYYPAVSLYMGATVRCEFGPHFAFPPALSPALEIATPPVSIQDANWESLLREVVLDLVDKLEAEEQSATVQSA